MRRGALIMQTTLTVNGSTHTVDVEPRLTLVDCLRHTLGLTGTHVGCEHGVCGACTVIVDGKPARGCLLLAVQADGTNVETVESLADGEALGPLQASFRRHHALQCGFCTPGVVMTMMELDQDRAGRSISEDEIRAALSGNLCRCTGYQGMVDAALELFGSHTSKA